MYSPALMIYEKHTFWGSSFTSTKGKVLYFGGISAKTKRIRKKKIFENFNMLLTPKIWIILHATRSIFFKLLTFIVCEFQQ